MLKEILSLSFLVIIFLIFKFLTRKKSNIPKKHPKGDYVLKIIINKSLRNDISQIISLMKDSLFELIPILLEDKDLFLKWRKSGEAKIVLVGTSDNMKKVFDQAIMKNIIVNCKSLDDKNLAIVVVGPGLKADINEFTTNFRMF